MPTQISEAPAILRGMLRDIVACSEYREVCQALGLVPAGPDVDRIEHYKSHMRIEKFNQVAGDVFPLADIAADAIHQLICVYRGDVEEAEDEAEQAMVLVVARMAAVTVISHLLEEKILEVPA